MSVLAAFRYKELVEHVHNIGASATVVVGVPPRNQFLFRCGRSRIEYVLIQRVDRLLLVALRQPRLAGEVEVPHVVGKEMAPHIGESRAIFREFSGVMIPSVNRGRVTYRALIDSCHKKLARRRKQCKGDRGRTLEGGAIGEGKTG